MAAKKRRIKRSTKRVHTPSGLVVFKRGIPIKKAADFLGLTMLEVKNNAKHFGITNTEVLQRVVNDRLKK